MSSDDSFIDVAGEAEIVCVDDELPGYLLSLKYSGRIIGDDGWR
jgi:hypothetical protein